MKHGTHTSALEYTKLTAQRIQQSRQRLQYIAGTN